MATIEVRGQDVRVGDDLWFLGKPHRITRIEPYTHPVVTRGEMWRIAYSDGPEGMYKAAWGMTLEYGHGWARGYEVTYLDGDDRKDSPPSEGDYLSPFYGRGAELWEAYRAEGSRLLWHDWLLKNGVPDVTWDRVPAPPEAKAHGKHEHEMVFAGYTGSDNMDGESWMCASDGCEYDEERP